MSQRTIGDLRRRRRRRRRRLRRCRRRGLLRYPQDIKRSRTFKTSLGLDYTASLKRTEVATL